MKTAVKGEFEACLACEMRPECSPHPCPINLEDEECKCCGVCAKRCADISKALCES